MRYRTLPFTRPQPSLVMNLRHVLVWGINILLAATSYTVAFMVRFDALMFPPSFRTIWLLSLPFAVLLKILMLLRCRVFSGLWRYVSAHDLVQLVKAMALYSLIFITLTTLTHIRVPRSIYIIDFALSLLLFGGIRLSVRIYRELRIDSKKGTGRRFLIIGAGDAGEIATRSLLRDSSESSTIAGYIDDDPSKKGRLLHGAPVLGGREVIVDAIGALHISDVLFAISSPSKELTEYVIGACGGLGVAFRILPSFCDIATGKVEVQRIRRVDIEDLLGRPAVRLDASQVRADLHNEVVLVTGAGGSIGGELARQIAAFAPARLLLLDTAETPLFEIEQELRGVHPTLPIEALLCNIKSPCTVERVFHLWKPTRIYHAAAYKHVPMLEAHPEQAVLNNICGTRNVAMAACRCGARRFVMISTDKAVHPSSIMGVSKRICEMVVAAMPANTTCFASVRFGNVLGSNGSVIPTFRRQIRKGGPVTVTHPDMTRFFMTIPEAVQLVLHCGTLAAHNDVFVLDMGTPVRIMDLARNMIRLSGREPDRDIDIRITGLRPGEKLHEELASYGEQIIPTPIDKVNVLKRNMPHLPPAFVMQSVEQLETFADQGDTAKVRECLWALIQTDALAVKNDLLADVGTAALQPHAPGT